MLTQTGMAEYLGILRAVVGPALPALVAAEIIELGRHCILILDIDRPAENAQI